MKLLILFFTYLSVSDAYSCRVRPRNPEQEKKAFTQATLRYLYQEEGRSKEDLSYIDLTHYHEKVVATWRGTGSCRNHVFKQIRQTLSFDINYENCFDYTVKVVYDGKSTTNFKILEKSSCK